MAKIHPHPGGGVDTNPNKDAEKHPFTRTDTTMSVDTAILAKQQNAGREDVGFITRMDSQGNLNEVAETGSLGGPEDFVSSSFFGRPLGSYAGETKKWNPFRKKSGILGVIHAQTKKNRVVSKHGKLNTIRKTEELGEGHRFLKDFFTSMIDLSWSTTLLSFAASFFISWLAFAVVWYIIVYVHGDLDPENLKDENHVVCVDNIKDFTSCFLFSLETQHTIGYGGRVTTEQCAAAIITMSIQSIVGVVIQACMAGIVFAKFTKPINRGETIMFSKNALITLRNGALYLILRVGDIRPTHLIECHVSGHMLRKDTTDEGEVVPYSLTRLEFGTEMDGSQDYFQMFWPLVISHKIDEESPLYDLAPRDILSRQFEIIITVEGTTPETGNSIQVRSSYLPNEILWGYRFEHTCVAYDKGTTKYAVSYSTINKFVADRTPRCSAKDLEEKKKKASYVSTFTNIAEQ